MPSRVRAVTQYASNLVRPYYVFRPAQAIRRVVSDFRPQAEEREFRLPWGARITCNPREAVGEGILRRGVFDLIVCETLLRLCDIGETALDVGANFGQMTSLLAYAVGESGQVIAFEPHPDVFARLAQNAALWRTTPRSARIELRELGVSNQDGTAPLSTDVFSINEGSATLEPLTQVRGSHDVHNVRVERLDTALSSVPQVGLMKLDIEGHEIHALEGATETLSAGRIRDILFEERDEPPTAVTRLLQDAGYEVMRVGERLRGPVVAGLDDREMRTKEGDDPSYLATRAPQRAIERLRPRGWAIYGVGPAGRIERARRENPGRTPGSTGSTAA